MSKARLWLGVDGGGTHCRVRLCDDAGQVLGEGRAGAANTRLGLSDIFVQIEAATEQALAQAGLANTVVGQLHAGLGLAGLNLSSELAKARAFPHPFASVALASDAVTACLGAHAGADGAVLVLGTGSCGCAIVNQQERFFGGLGMRLSDHASGANLGLAALRQALLAADKIIVSTPLCEQVLAQFNHDTEQAVLWADQAQARDYAAFAPLVFECAQHGDKVAQDLLKVASEEAALLIQAMLDYAAPKVVLLGGLAAAMTPSLPVHLQQRLVAAQGDALDGAILLARKQL